MGTWPTQGSQTYALIRYNPDTEELEQILFDQGIIGRMQVTDNEWKPLGHLTEVLKP